jgi:23S rRNA (adenine2503-C2)-methyltransferase
MDIKKVEEILKENYQPMFRLEQIKKAVYQEGAASFLEISTLPKDLREMLNKMVRILSFDIANLQKSSDGRSIKALLMLRDGNLTETVLIAPKIGLWSVCVSSQVGCPLGCGFCATGQEGFKRHLTTEEITDQILFWKQYLAPSSKENQQDDTIIAKAGVKISNVVFMGMGEPFLNWKNVSNSLRDLTDRKLFGFGARSISISTAGIPSGIERLVQTYPQINLAISLHFADDDKRSAFMPINREYNLDDLKLSMQQYFKKANRKIFIEYIMISRVNDSQEDALKLARYLESVGKTHLLHVNLIKYNKTGLSYEPSSLEKIRRFKDKLIGRKINCTVRKSMGAEVFGACGQLAGKRK